MATDMEGRKTWWDRFRENRIVHLCYALSFFTSGLIINIAQCLLFYGLKPFNKRLYRKIGYYLCYSFNCQFIFLCEWWSNSKLHVYIDPEVLKTYIGKEHVLILYNHTYEIDWLIGWAFCDKVGVLGNCKAYAKKVIQYMPLIGWSWKFAEYIFLNRSFEKDRELIGKQLNEIFDYPDPVWLMLTPEGTRFTTEKHAASVKFAQEKGMTPLKHHLIPRTKGFTASLPFLRKKCPCILDIELAFPKDAKVKPTVFNILSGHPVEGYMIVRRIETKDVPEDEAAAAEWLQERFREKDRIMESFHKHGDFFTGTGIKPMKSISYKPRLVSMINTLTWLALILSTMFYYIYQMVINQQIVGLIIVGLIFVTIYVLMTYTICMSKVSKSSSSYGADKSVKSQ